MKRRLFNAGMVVSLVLALAIVVLWARSYRTATEVSRLALPTAGSSVERYSQMTLRDGVLWLHEIQMGGMEALPDEEPVQYEFEWDRPEAFIRVMNNRAPVWLTALGISWGPSKYGADLTVPLWLLALLLSLLPAVAGTRLIKRWLGGPGANACPACGYDLRGTPSGGGGGSECPECGAAPGKREAKA